MDNAIWPILGIMLIIGVSYVLSDFEEKNKKK